MNTLACPYCNEPAAMTNGLELYPGRYDLEDKKFWACLPCEAWVGCHPETDKPLGGLANRELRHARMGAHARFDPIWKSKMKHMRRSSAYAWLSKQLDIPVYKCHIGTFDLETCRRVMEVVRIYHAVRGSSRLPPQGPKPMAKWREQLNRALDCTAPVLNDWEVGFIENISKRADSPGWEPSILQLIKLEQIDEKVP